METHQNLFQHGSWQSPLIERQSQLVLLFGDRDLATGDSIRAEIREAFPLADIIGCTTAGEISGAQIYDNALCLTAVTFATSTVLVAHGVIDDDGAIDNAVDDISAQLDPQGLKHVLVLSDGQRVNGTELIQKLQGCLPEGVSITGGLAGDGAEFSETIVWFNEKAGSGHIVVCGFYGANLSVGYGSVGGWDTFGPERLVTKSCANILYSLDSEPALEFYKKYLGEHASDLPASALLYPLQISHEHSDTPLTRTILNISEQDNSMIFAGDIPQGARAQLMHANFDKLIKGAEQAADQARQSFTVKNAGGLAILVSCVGRRLVLNQRTEEELEAVCDALGSRWATTGFYSYGEISPSQQGEACALHNQTMTITAIFEKDA